MKRNDARQCYDVPSFNLIFPFMMRRRSDSLVYHSFDLDVTKTVEYIRAYNANKPEFRLKFFYVFCAAVMRTFMKRPELNRFIASSRYWQRNEYSLNFIVKESFTDDAPETSSPLVFDKDMTLMSCAKAIDSYIKDARNVSNQSSFTDDTIGKFLHLPTGLLSTVIRFLGFLDRRGKLPQFVRDADGLHASVFIANLGSIGIMGGSPHHHLYEWGTTSMFITLGMLERKREFDDDGKVVSSRETIQMGATVDERITSGFYFIKSMAILQDYLNHPERLETTEEFPKETISKKEYKAALRQRKKERKLQKSEQSHS